MSIHVFYPPIVKIGVQMPTYSSATASAGTTWRAWVNDHAMPGNGESEAAAIGDAVLLASSTSVGSADPPGGALRRVIVTGVFGGACIVLGALLAWTLLG